MKKTLRFAALVAVCLAAWLTRNPQAQAATTWCVDVEGNICHPNGAKLHCVMPGNTWAVCTCIDGVWDGCSL